MRSTRLSLALLASLLVASPTNAQRAPLQGLDSLIRQSMGRPYMAPPGTPTARVRALRTAFNRMVADPAFLAAATKRRGRKTRQGLPEGWVIDDEGYVVPGSS